MIDIPSIKIYVNKIEIKITFGRHKGRYHFKVSTLEMMRLLGSIKIR